MNTSNITNYKPKDFAELLGISVNTLQRWDREGILKAVNPKTNCFVCMDMKLSNWNFLLFPQYT